MTAAREYGTLSTSPDGWITCPVCGYKRLKKRKPDESADLVYIHCRNCKNDIPLTLKQGEGLQGQGQRNA